MIIFAVALIIISSIIISSSLLDSLGSWNVYRFLLRKSFNYCTKKRKHSFSILFYTSSMLKECFRFFMQRGNSAVPTDYSQILLRNFVSEKEWALCYSGLCLLNYFCISLLCPIPSIAKSRELLSQWDNNFYLIEFLSHWDNIQKLLWLHLVTILINSNRVYARLDLSVFWRRCEDFLSEVQELKELYITT